MIVASSIVTSMPSLMNQSMADGVLDVSISRHQIKNQECFE